MAVSAVAWSTLPMPAAPNATTELMWPVRPSRRCSIVVLHVATLGRLSHTHRSRTCNRTAIGRGVQDTTVSSIRYLGRGCLERPRSDRPVGQADRPLHTREAGRRDDA